MNEPTDRFMAVVRPVEGFNFPYPDKALPENSFKALVAEEDGGVEFFLEQQIASINASVTGPILPAGVESKVEQYLK